MCLFTQSGAAGSGCGSCSVGFRDVFFLKTADTDQCGDRESVRSFTSKYHESG